MIPEISIATLADRTRLVKLINSAYRGASAKKGWTHEADLLSGERVTNKELTQLLNRENTFLLKYSEHNDILACVLLEKQQQKLYVGMLTVSPVLQGKGIGKKLLQAAEEKARELGCNKTEMSVISIRQELIDWYKRRGYAYTGVIKPFPEEMQKFASPGYKPEFIIMEKRL